MAAVAIICCRCYYGPLNIFFNQEIKNKLFAVCKFNDKEFSRIKPITFQFFHATPPINHTIGSIAGFGMA